MSTRMSTNRQADLVIIGGGVIGLSIARALALRGAHDILVIEKNQFGQEASWAAGGILAPQVEADCADDFFRLACASRDLYRSFAADLRAETGVDIKLDTSGTLCIGFDDIEERELRARLDWQRSQGLQAVWLTGEQARLLEPKLSPKVACALLLPNDFQVDNRCLVNALLAANLKLGVRLITGCEALSLIVEENKICGVETSLAQFSTEKVVLAAGAWSSQISSPVALPQIKVEPIRGQMLCFQAQPQIVQHVIYSSRGYLVPRGDGRLLAGSTSERVGFEKTVTEQGIAAIRSIAIEIAPVVGELPLLDAWAGLRPRAGDDLPVIGTTERVKGLFYATGHFRNGILLAPITGELIAEVIVADVQSTLMKPFSPDRFLRSQ